MRYGWGLRSLWSGRWKTALLLGLAVLAVPSTVLAGGNIVITGHDDDHHAAGCGSRNPAALQFVAFIAFARSGAPNPSLPVLSFDHGVEVTRCLRTLGIPFTNIDPDSGVPAAGNFDVARYSAMVVASDASCNGCDNTSTSIANLVAATGAIGSFLNNGGGIVAFAGAHSADRYYGFLPASASGFGSPPAAGYIVTPFGASIGIPAVNGNETHNFFNAPGTGGVSALYKVAEQLGGAGTIETLACANCTTAGLVAGSPRPAIRMVSSAELGSGTVGRPFSAALAADGGSGSYTWSAQGWPANLGLSLNPSTGLVSGTPGLAGTFSLPIQVSDKAGSAPVSRVFTLTIAPQPAIRIVSAAELGSATTGRPFSASLAAEGGTAPYTWSARDWPAGIGLNLDPSTGVIAGTPARPGTVSLPVQASDGAGSLPGTRVFTLTLTPRPAIHIVNPELGEATAGRPFSATLSADGGTGPYTWTAQDWPTDLGLTLNPSTGVISGTPTRPGTVRLSVEATDGAGSLKGSRVFSLKAGTSEPITPYLTEPRQIDIDTPVKLIAGLHNVSEDPVQRLRELGERPVISANIEGESIELHDDGTGGDEVAGDGKYTATVTFRNSGSIPVGLRPVIAAANRATEEHVEVNGVYSYRSGPAELNLGALRENGSSCKPWIPDAQQKGMVPLRLHLLGTLPAGHSLEIRAAGKTLKADDGQIPLAPETRMEVCLVTDQSAESSDARGEPWLRLSIGYPRSQNVDLRLRWHVDGVPFWRRWLWLLELIAVLAVATFLVYGYIKPHRFPRGLAITFVPEYDELDQTPQPLSQWRDVRIGFYRDARASLQPSYRVNGRSNGALAILTATADGVWVEPGHGTTLFREVDATEWREVTSEGQAGRRGLVYRVGDKGPYFRLGSRS